MPRRHERRLKPPINRVQTIPWWVSTCPLQNSSGACYEYYYWHEVCTFSYPPSLSSAEWAEFPSSALAVEGGGASVDSRGLVGVPYRIPSHWCPHPMVRMPDAIDEMLKTELRPKGGTRPPRLRAYGGSHGGLERHGEASLGQADQAITAIRKTVRSPCTSHKPFVCTLGRATRRFGISNSPRQTLHTSSTGQGPGCSLARSPPTTP